MAVEVPAIDYGAAGLALQEDTLALSKAQFDWQRQQAKERKANIAESMAAIDEIFTGRAPIYDQLKQESMGLNMEQLNRLEADAARDLNFALARSGNTGGSVEIDKNRRMAEQMGIGAAGVEQFAQSQADKLKAQDEGLRGAMLGLAASGGVSGTQVGGAARSAISGLGGTALYAPQLNQTFQGLSSNIGAAGQAG